MEDMKTRNEDAEEADAKQVVRAANKIIKDEEEDGKKAKKGRVGA